MIAHFGSILPKIGLTEADLPAERTRAARRRGRADRPGDRDLRALALPVRRARCARSCATASRSRSRPTATSARRSAATTHCLAVRSASSQQAEPAWPCSIWILTAFVIAGALPLVAGCYQFAARGAAPLPACTRERRARARAERRGRGPGLERGGGDRAHDRHAAGARLPGRSGCASTSSTTPAPTRRPTSCSAKAAEHPGRVFHLRRDKGGEGKAHTLNHGLREIRAEGWYEAVLIIDADVIFTAALAAQDGAPPRATRGRRGHGATSRRAAGPPTT